MLAFPETVPCCFMGSMAERAYALIFLPLACRGLGNEGSRHDGSERSHSTFRNIGVSDPFVCGPVVHAIMYVCELISAAGHGLYLVCPKGL